MKCSRPALFALAPKTAERFIEFFAAQTRNANTRKAYAKATGAFVAWRPEHGITELGQVRPVHIAAYIEGLQKKLSVPSIKLQFAAIRMLHDRLMVSQVVPVNPAGSVKGPKHSVKKGKTAVLSAEEAQEFPVEYHWLPEMSRIESACG